GGKLIPLEGNSSRHFGAVRRHELAIDVDVSGVFGGYRQHRIGTRHVCTVAADTAVEIGPLLVVLGPRIGMHTEPLRGHVVEEEETGAHGGEDREEADELLPGEPSLDLVES